MVYLLHFDRRYKHAGHYCGWCRDLALRLIAHRAGRGARLTEVIRAEGIGFQVVRLWDAGRGFERKLKDSHCLPRLCPICSGSAAYGRRRQGCYGEIIDEGVPF